MARHNALGLDCYAVLRSRPEVARTPLGQFVNPIIEPEYVRQNLSDRDI